MKIIVGLGNPGSAYSKTRHNIGRRLIEYVAERYGVRFSKKKPLQASVAEVEREGDDVLLAYPENFMNLSGASVSLLAHHFEISPSKDLLVLVDDVALPYGCLRLRGKGSDGGHNGLKSIHQELHTTSYARLRIGIQPSEQQAITSDTERKELKEFVLSKFTPAEERGVEGVLNKGFEACELWLRSPIEKAMSVVNPFEK